jgi:hypothetical protein
MLIVRRGETNNLVVTMSMNRTLNNPFYLMSFQHIASKEFVRFYPTILSSNTRYDLISFNEGSNQDLSATPPTVFFPYLGQYYYSIYEMASSGTTNPDNAYAKLEAGRAWLIKDNDKDEDNCYYEEYISENEIDEKIIYVDDCEAVTPPPTPTPSITPSITPTQTVTPTEGLSPTPTPTNTITPTQTLTPTNTLTPTPSPEVRFKAYVFAEPQTFEDGSDLENYMVNTMGKNWGGYQFYGVPSSLDYSSTMDAYVHYPLWGAFLGNYITPPTELTSIIKQTSGASLDTFNCPQNQYTFGTIEIPKTGVNTDIRYFYSIWLSYDGLGGSFTNMTVDAGSSPCSNDLINNAIPDYVASQNVTVTSGGAIPAGNYRVLWLQNLNLPITNTLLNNIYIKGENKY